MSSEVPGGWEEKEAHTGTQQPQGKALLCPCKSTEQKGACRHGLRQVQTPKQATGCRRVTGSGSHTSEKGLTGEQLAAVEKRNAIFVSEQPNTHSPGLFPANINQSCEKRAKPPRSLLRTIYVLGRVSHNGSRKHTAAFFCTGSPLSSQLEALQPIDFLLPGESIVFFFLRILAVHRKQLQRYTQCSPFGSQDWLWRATLTECFRPTASQQERGCNIVKAFLLTPISAGEICIGEAVGRRT